MKKRKKLSTKRYLAKLFATHKVFIAYCFVAGVILGLLVALIVQDRTPQLGKIGDKVETSAYSVIIESVTRAPYREVFTHKSIGELDGLVIRLTVKNKSDVPQAFLPVNDMFIKDNFGAIHQLEPVFGIPSPIMAGELAAGQSVTGDVSYVLENKNRDLRLFFDPRWDASPPIAIEL